MRKCYYLLIGIAIFLVLSAVIFAEENDSPFELTAYPVAGDLRVVFPVSFKSSGVVGVWASFTGSLDEDSRVVGYQMRDGMLEVQNDNLFPKQTGSHLSMVLGEGLALVKGRVKDYEFSDDPRLTRTYNLVDVGSMEARDVTPTNLVETTQWLTRGGTSVLWSDVFGIVLLSYDKETREIVLWNGNETVHEVMRTPPILARGRTYIDGRLTYAFLTNEGQMFVYNWDTGNIVESARHAAIGKEIAQAIGARPDHRPRGFVLADGIAVFKAKDKSAFVVVGEDGERLDIGLYGGIDLTMEEFLKTLSKDMTQAELETAASDYLLGIERANGITFPANETSTMSKLIPIDDTHVGLLDNRLQRLILIGPGN